MEMRDGVYGVTEFTEFEEAEVTEATDQTGGTEERRKRKQFRGVFIAKGVLYRARRADGLRAR
jgi:hypothetical protein